MRFPSYTLGCRVGSVWRFFRGTLIAKLVCAIVASIQFMVDTAKCFIIDEGAQQLIMTGTPLVSTGENSIDDTQPAGRTKSLRCQPLAEWHDAAKHCSRMFQGSGNRGTNRNDASV